MPPTPTSCISFSSPSDDGMNSSSAPFKSSRVTVDRSDASARRRKPYWWELDPETERELDRLYDLLQAALV